MQYPASWPNIGGFLRLKTWLSSKGIISRVILSIAGIAIGVTLLVQLISRIDFSEAPQHLSQISVWGFALALLPYTFIALLDTSAWRRLLPERFPFLKIFNIRSATEAIVIAAPMGSVLSDPAKAWMLKRRFNLRLSQTTASITLRKLSLGLGQSVVALSVAAAAWFFAPELQVHDLPAGLLTGLVTISIIIIAIYGVVTSFVCYGSLIRHAHKLLLKIRIEKVQRWMLAQEERFEELHHDFERLGRQGLREVQIAGVQYIALWALELVETYVILRILGIDISFAQASVIEAVCTMARAIAFMVPGGVGVQDTGYASLLIASGVQTPSIAAFILLKRLREVLWAALGFALLFAERRQLAAAEDIPVINHTHE